ncbi:MAG: NAD(P)H:quinone oxidoreductase [Rhizomicrobium sp.]
MTNVLIAFYSREGSVQALAQAVADGAMNAGGAVRLRRAREIVSAEIMASVPGWVDSAARMNSLYEAPTEDDAKWADAIIFGSPTRFGLIASELKAYIDSLGALWARGRLNLKVGSAFSSTSSPHGGNEMTNFTLFAPMAHFGMVIVPPGYGDNVMMQSGTPYGVTSISHGGKAAPSGLVLEAARFQGQRVTQVAAALADLRK